ncbi:MAG: glycosyltransferase family 2 protein, partial [Actinomycetota bacterium]
MRQRRQLGCRDEPGGLPVLERVPRRRTVSAARFAVFFTVASWAVFVVDQVRRLVARGIDVSSVAEAVFFLVLISSLTAASLAYLVARLGHLYRARDHQRVPRAIIDDHFDAGAPTLTVLVPSFREEGRVIRQTLLRAALQEYPDLELVLLIDDPPVPAD